MEVSFTSKRFIYTLVFILAFISVFRVLRIIISSYPSSSHSHQRDTHTFISLNSRPTITEKEYNFLSNFIYRKVPCNILIFGWEPEYLRLAKMNNAAGGSTIFLVDHPQVLLSSNSIEIYKVNYNVPAKQAYELLKYARGDIACAPHYSGPLETSSCKLALKNLPNTVYRQKWDVIIVDGPSSDGPEAPGRMAAIYTASVLARTGKNVSANVVVHDVDRMIERWFSWEFLCQENLVSSKGRYWNFKIRGGKQSNSTSFCSIGDSDE